LSEFASYRPTILQHGTEELAQVQNARRRVSSYNPEGDIATLRNRLTQILAASRSPLAHNPLQMIAADDDFLVLERKSPDGHSHLLVVNKSRQSMTRHFVLPQGVTLNTEPLSGTSMGSVTLTHSEQGVNCAIAPQSFAVFETGDR
jgi:hypothetical protein